LHQSCTQVESNKIRHIASNRIKASLGRLKPLSHLFTGADNSV
jgi:hypothetical protein